MAETRREFQQLARMRLKDARILMRGGNVEGAYYLTGLAVECAVKACIAKNTRRYDFPPNQNALKDIYTHDLAKLIGAAKLQTALDIDRRRNISFNNKWDVVKDWSINSRYAIGGLNARDLYRAVAGRNGVMTATATLVNNDIEIGRRIVAALTRAPIPVTVYLWAFIPQLQEWQFIVATPLVDTKGPLAAYGEVNKALQKEGVFDDIPLRRIFLRSPSDRVLKFLEKDSRAVPQESFRVVNEHIAGNFVEDAYVYGGSIFIKKVNISRPNPHEYYSVIYTPRSDPRQPASPLRFERIEDVRRFLEEGLRMDKQTADSQIAKLGIGQSALIPVSLTPAQLRALGLA